MGVHNIHIQIFNIHTIFTKSSHYCPEGAGSQSPGLAAFFAAYPGERLDDGANPERVASIFNPFRVDTEWNLIPRVERHKAPLNPGLCDDAPSGL